MAFGDGGTRSRADGAKPALRGLSRHRDFAQLSSTEGSGVGDDDDAAALAARRRLWGVVPSRRRLFGSCGDFLGPPTCFRKGIKPTPDPPEEGCITERINILTYYVKLFGLMFIIFMFVPPFFPIFMVFTLGLYAELYVDLKANMCLSDMMFGLAVVPGARVCFYITLEVIVLVVKLTIGLDLALVDISLEPWLNVYMRNG